MDIKMKRQREYIYDPHNIDIIYNRFKDYIYQELKRINRLELLDCKFTNFTGKEVSILMILCSLSEHQAINALERWNGDLTIAAEEHLRI